MRRSRRWSGRLVFDFSARALGYQGLEEKQNEGKEAKEGTKSKKEGRRKEGREFTLL